MAQIGKNLRVALITINGKIPNWVRLSIEELQKSNEIVLACCIDYIIKVQPWESSPLLSLEAFGLKQKKQLWKSVAMENPDCKMFFLSDSITQREAEILHLGIKELKIDILINPGVNFPHHVYFPVSRIDSFKILAGHLPIPEILKSKKFKAEEWGVEYIIQQNGHIINNSVNFAAIDGFWITRVLNKYYQKAADFFMKSLIAEPRVYKEKEISKTAINDGKNGITHHYIKSLKSFIRKQRYSLQWQLLYTFEKTDYLNIDPDKFLVLEPPADRDWADPFPFYIDDKYYLFFEEKLHKKGHGFLSYVEIEPNGNITHPEIIFQEPYHLSYPNVITVKDEIFMIPESSANENVVILRAVQFPSKWTKVKVLIDQPLVDSTVIFHENKWYLFGNMRNKATQTSLEDLHIFYTDDIINSAWISHPLNPVVRDAATARPAGKIITEGTKIYRPSQDCSLNYGGGISIMEIIELTENTYKEKKLSVINPADKMVTGLHTINRSGKLTMMDRRIFRKK